MTKNIMFWINISGAHMCKLHFTYEMFMVEKIVILLGSLIVITLCIDVLWEQLFKKSTFHELQRTREVCLS